MTQDLLAPRPAHDASTIRVASIPSTHVYVRHLAPAGDADDGVWRLPDPLPAGGPQQSPWWPPVMLDASWVEDQHDSFDVFHVHFGFDARTPAELRELTQALRKHGKPLVLTVHDLRNPHHPTPELHDAQLAALVPAAQALVTLTPGAAAAVERRWGVRPLVVAHPHVVELDLMARLQDERATRAHRPFRVGLHVKSVRAGMDPAAVLPTLVRAVEGLDDTVLQVNGHTELLSHGGRHHDRDLSDLLRSYGDRIDLRVHDYFDDDQLWDYLASLDASVLPYRFGTHSGWLEACRDLGTAVVAPTCGFYAEQGPVHSYDMDEDRFDEASLVDAVRRAYEDRAVAVSVEERERQRDGIARAHRDLYTSLLRA